MTPPAPKLRIVGSRSEHAKRFQSDISALLASTLKLEPGLSTQEAMRKVQETLLSNNPYTPPKDGKCLINELPAKILSIVFRLGVEMQGEEEDEDQYEEVEESDDEDGDDEKEGAKTVKLGGTPVVDADDDEDDPDWEDAEGEEESDDDEDEVPFEILVSHVCKYWREIAINTSDLWNAIYIDEPHQWRRYETYLERAKDEPLDIDINIDGDDILNESDEPRDDAAYSQDAHKIMDLLVPKASQWRHLLVATSYWRDARIVLKRLHDIPAAPLLEALQFHCYDIDGEGDGVERAKEPTYLPFHGVAPKLHTAALWSVHFDWDGAVALFKNLKELELAYHKEEVLPSWNAFSSYLQNSPELVRLELKSSGPRSDSSWLTAPLEVPSLRELVVAEHEPVYALALATKLHFPGLHSISIDYEEGDEDYTKVVEAYSKPLPGVSGTDHKSLFGTIEALEMYALGRVQADAFESMLNALTSVKHLSLVCEAEEAEEGGEDTEVASQSVGVPRRIWNALEANAKVVVESKKDVLLPLLEGLRTSEIPSSELRSFLENRVKIEAPLKRLVMHGSDHITEGDEDWFNENLEEFSYYNDDGSSSLGEGDWTDEEDGGEDNGDEDNDDDTAAGVEEEGVRVKARRVPSARIARASAGGRASSRVTTGLSKLD